MNKEFTPRPGRLMDQVKETLCFHHYAYSTEKSYIQRILRYIRFNVRRHPKEMGKQEIERYLSHLATNCDVTVSTQNQALNAILFLYKHVLKSPVEADIRAIRSIRPTRLPTVLSKQEIQALFSHISEIKLN